MRWELAASTAPKGKILCWKFFAGWNITNPKKEEFAVCLFGFFLFDFNGVKPCFGVDYFLRLGCFVLKDNQFLGRKCWCVLKLRSLT